MDQSKGGNWQYGVTALAVAAAVATGYFNRSEKLESRRPLAEAVAQETQTQSPEQPFEARLWQDPLTAVRRPALPPSAASGAAIFATTVPPASSSSFAQLSETLHERAAHWHRGTNGNLEVGVEVLVVMVPSSMAAEDVEARLRARQTVALALSTLKFQPAHEDRLGAVRLVEEVPPAVKRGSDLQIPETPPPHGPAPAVLPFEWYQVRSLEKAEHQQPGELLVLWVPGDAAWSAGRTARNPEAGADPLSFLRRLRVQLFGPDGGINCPAYYRYTVLGPRGSGALQAVGESLVPTKGKRLLEGMRMFSWSATASDEFLFEDSTAPHNPHGLPRAWLCEDLKRRFGIDFQNVITTDELLVRALIGELKLRDVDLTQPGQHVALIFEADTLYGRTLPLTWAAEIIEAKMPRAARQSDRWEIIRSLKGYKPEKGKEFHFPKAENLHA